MIGDDLAVEIDKSVEFVAKNSPEDLKAIVPTPSKLDKADLLTTMKELKDDGYSV